jgi:hypothetical protein
VTIWHESGWWLTWRALPEDRTLGESMPGSR